WRDGGILSSFIRTGNANGLKVADKTNALARIGLDQYLILAGVADGFPRGSDAGAERRFRNDAAVPYRCDQIVPAHHAIAVLQQIKQEIQNLGFQCHWFGVAGGLALVTVQNAARQDELHWDPSGSNNN